MPGLNRMLLIFMDLNGLNKHAIWVRKTYPAKISFFQRILSMKFYSLHLAIHTVFTILVLYAPCVRDSHITSNMFAKRPYMLIRTHLDFGLCKAPKLAANS
jgi:hypothetical protein